MGKLIDLAGQVFGHLSVIKKLDADSNGNLKWECLCICGNITIAYGDNLRRNHTKSCGCLKFCSNTVLITHGHSVGDKVSPEYTAYYNMMDRCYNENNSHKEYYLEKGVKVCDRWLESFENFLADMGKRPSKKHSLDRYPNIDGNYEKDNCRWATLIQQAQNKTNNVWYEHNGVRKIHSDWAVLFGVTNNAITFHLKKGKSFSEIYNHFMQAS